MNNFFERISRSLAAKLILALLSIIIVGGGISWYALIRAGKKNLMNDAVKSTASYSDLVKKSIRYDMLTFNREAIQRTIEHIGAAEDIKKIRIFDGKGRIVYSSQQGEIGNQVDGTSRACAGCHAGSEKPADSLAGKNQWITYQGREGYTLIAFVDPIYNEPSCSQVSCHAHSSNQRVLGVLETDFSLESVDKNIRAQAVTITFYALVLMGVSSVILFVVLRKFVLKPVSALSSAMDNVAQGDLTPCVLWTSEDEMGRLTRAFNDMICELETARGKMQQWTQTLEEEIAKKTDELKKSQDKLIQAEKLAALGRLTADVAHEIRNPLTAIGGFARRLYKIAADGKEKKHAEIIRAEVDRLEKILRDVLTFSRDARFHLHPHHIEEIVDDVVKFYDDVCREQSMLIEVDKEENLLPVLIDKDQVRQALNNLITNATDAMPNGGVLTIRAGTEDLHDVRYVFLKVSDTGQGILEDQLPLIFEPFFTTKEIGYGTGLGLSITRKIMEEHGGFIRAESTVGHGSTFSLYFPQQSEEESRGTPCWEYMKCGRDNDSTLKCPAHPNFGRICWVVAGTFCEGKVQGTFAQKYEDCRKCQFYQKVKNKEL